MKLLEQRNFVAVNLADEPAREREEEHTNQVYEQAVKRACEHTTRRTATKENSVRVCNKFVFTDTMRDVLEFFS